MAIIEVSIIPLGTRTPSASKHIANALKVLEKENVKYELTSMGTIIEGDLGEILEIARKMHEAVFESEEVLRVLTTIKIDDRRDKPLSMEGKIKSVKEKLGKK